jgi:hypothetical protein
MASSNLDWILKSNPGRFFDGEFAKLNPSLAPDTLDDRKLSGLCAMYAMGDKTALEKIIYHPDMPGNNILVGKLLSCPDVDKPYQPLWDAAAYIVKHQQVLIYAFAYFKTRFPETVTEGIVEMEKVAHTEGRMMYKAAHFLFDWYVNNREYQKAIDIIPQMGDEFPTEPAVPKLLTWLADNNKLTEEVLGAINKYNLIKWIVEYTASKK